MTREEIKQKIKDMDPAKVVGTGDLVLAGVVGLLATPLLGAGVLALKAIANSPKANDDLNWLNRVDPDRSIRAEVAAETLQRKQAYSKKEKEEKLRWEKITASVRAMTEDEKIAIVRNSEAFAYSTEFEWNKWHNLSADEREQQIQKAISSLVGYPGLWWGTNYSGPHMDKYAREAKLVHRAVLLDVLEQRKVNIAVEKALFDALPKEEQDAARAKVKELVAGDQWLVAWFRCSPWLTE